MNLSTCLPETTDFHFPPFSLERLLSTTLRPRVGEKLCILIDLENPQEIVNLRFLKDLEHPIQKNAYHFFYKPLKAELMNKFALQACDIFAYQMTMGSNLNLPTQAFGCNGQVLKFNNDIYPYYDLILCISTYSATAPLTASAKKFGFRGATLHGLNEIIIHSGLSVDYHKVSRQTERLRQGLTKANSIDIDFEVDTRPYHLHIDLGKQEARKSHGICHEGADIANLPAGEVYFVPTGAEGSFPIKFEDGTLGLMHVNKGRVKQLTLIRGHQATIDSWLGKLREDPACGALGELGFGTQLLPYSGSDIQDEKILGTFHIATGRNDHLDGQISEGNFSNPLNATHEDILFSYNKTPEIAVKQVRMRREGKTEILIEDYHPCSYLLGLISE